MRLFIEQDTMGSLNLYADAVDAFDDEDRSVASIFASHAAVALRAAQRQEQLIDAIDSRDVIGQAKGIIMARKGVDDDVAFAMLRDASSRMNRKLREVAQQVIEHEQES
jgi:AmiR/NasT family two-component response regulator